MGNYVNYKIRKLQEENEVMDAQLKRKAKAKAREEATGLKVFTFLFAHPKDREVVERDFRDNGFDGILHLHELVERGKPVLYEEEYNPKYIERLEVKGKLLEYWRKFLKERENRPRRKYEIRLPYPHSRQRTIIYSKKRFKVMVCGRRFGKTTAALIAAVLRAVGEERQIIYYIAPTYRQAKTIAWSMLSEMVGSCYSRRNEQDLMFELPNGSKIFLKGADNPDSLRGTYVHLAILDEYANIKPHIWDEIISPMLIDTRGDAWFLGTPRGHDHFYKLWDKVFRGKKGSDWIAFRLTSWDNPHLEREELEREKEMKDPRAYAQEIMAEFVQFEGLVYAEFKRARHVKAFDIKKVKGIDICGLDWGADHPTAGAYVRLGNDGCYYVWREYYERGRSVEEHAKALKKLEKGCKVRRRYLDPSAKQAALDLKRNGIATAKAVNDRVYGISQIRGLLQQGKLKIHPDCVNLIYEFEHHRYKDKASISKDKNKKDVDQAVLKQDDDVLDALRYAIATHLRGKSFKFEGREYYNEFDNLERAGASRSFDRIDLSNNRHLLSSDVSGGVAKEFQHLH